MQLFLIRHAQSQNNALPEEQRVEDPPLTELGQLQAKHLADWIPSLGLTRLFTSPFLRALQTAQPIHAATCLTPEVRVELHEKGGCYGGYTPENIVGRPGMSREEIEREFSGFRVGPGIEGQGWWRSRPHETQAAARRRAGKLLQRTCDEFADSNERVALVLHADLKLLLLEHLHPEPLECPCNASITTVRITSTGTQLVEYNRVGHLPAELITR